MNIRDSLPVIFVTLASLTLTSTLFSSGVNEFNSEHSLLNEDFESLTTPEQLIAKFLAELKNLNSTLKYSALAAIASTIAAVSTYNVHLKKIDMKIKTKKPTKSLTEKIDLQNLSDHTKYLFYKTMSYLAYQDETGEWYGALPVLDNSLMKISNFFRGLKKRIDPIICLSVTYLIIKHSITADRVKMLTKAAK